MRLVESGYFHGYTVEDTLPAGGGLLTVRGVFGRADAKNENGRVYPKKVWEKVLREGSEATTRIRNRNFFGEVDHPDDGRTLLQRTSHIVTELAMTPDGKIVGRAEILPTPAGKTLEALFKANTLVGISSRGEGDVLRESDTDIVQDNYDLQAFDFVHNPSTEGAYPKPVRESLLVGPRNGETMDLTEDYRELEKSVLELASLKLSDVPPALRPLMERQANETLVKLSKLSESAGDYRPLFAGLLSELQGVRRGFMKELSANLAEDTYDFPTLSRWKQIKGLPKQGEMGATDGIEPLPDQVTPESIPPIPGSETTQQTTSEPPKTIESKQEESMAGTTGNMGGKTLRSIVREAEDALAELDYEEGDEAEKMANAVAEKVESRLTKLSRKFIEAEGGLMPNSYVPADSAAAPTVSLPNATENDDEDEDDTEVITASTDDTVEAEMKKEESRRRRRALRMMSEADELGGDTVEIPEPPADLATEEEEDPELEAKNPNDPVAALEAKTAKLIRRLVRENKRLRYERTVTEHLAAKSLAKLSRRVRAAESVAMSAPMGGATSIVANGKRIPVKVAGEVIESLVAKYKTLNRTRMTEATTNESVSNEGPFPTFGRVSDPSKLNEALARPKARNSSQSLIEAQGAAAAAVAKRIGRF